jgi:hypothetical protein
MADDRRQAGRLVLVLVAAGLLGWRRPFGSGRALDVDRRGSGGRDQQHGQQRNRRVLGQGAEHGQRPEPVADREHDQDHDGQRERDQTPVADAGPGSVPST